MQTSSPITHTLNYSVFVFNPSKSSVLPESQPTHDTEVSKNFKCFHLCSLFKETEQYRHVPCLYVLTLKEVVLVYLNSSSEVPIPLWLASYHHLHPFLNHPIHLLAARDVVSQELWSWGTLFWGKQGKRHYWKTHYRGMALWLSSVICRGPSQLEASKCCPTFQEWQEESLQQLHAFWSH